VAHGGGETLEQARERARALAPDDAARIVHSNVAGGLRLVLLMLLDRILGAWYERAVAPDVPRVAEPDAANMGASAAEAELRARLAEAERAAAADPHDERAAHRRQALNMVLGLLEDISKAEGAAEEGSQ
jgi:hypothetical protein